MQRYLDFVKTNRWIDALDDLVYNYNHSYHSTIGMCPYEAYERVSEVLRYFKLNKPNHKIKFQVGDKVRIYRYKMEFSKGYEKNYTDEIFTVVEIFHTIPKMYAIKDSDNEIIEGRFYAQELSKIQLA